MLHVHQDTLWKLPSFRETFLKKSLSQVSIDMPDQDPDVISALIEHLYTGDYTYAHTQNHGYDASVGAQQLSPLDDPETLIEETTVEGSSLECSIGVLGVTEGDILGDIPARSIERDALEAIAEEWLEGDITEDTIGGGDTPPASTEGSVEGGTEAIAEDALRGDVPGGTAEGPVEDITEVIAEGGVNDDATEIIEGVTEGGGLEATLILGGLPDGFDEDLADDVDTEGDIYEDITERNATKRDLNEGLFHLEVYSSASRHDYSALLKTALGRIYEVFRELDDIDTLRLWKAAYAVGIRHPLVQSDDSSDDGSVVGTDDDPEISTTRMWIHTLFKGHSEEMQKTMAEYPELACDLLRISNMVVWE